MNITQSAWLLVMIAVAGICINEGRVSQITTQQPPAQTQTK
jgi:hypothetical protein